MPARRPPSPLPPWARKFRAPVPVQGLGTDPRQHDRQSIAIGIGATIVVHLLFVFLPSSLYRVETTVPPPVPEEVELELVDEVAVPEENPAEPLPEYVPTNPNAPENEPDDTINQSDRSQQAANEERPDTLSPDNTPAREGEDVEGNSIVTGAPTEPTPPPMPAPAPDSEAQAPVEAVVPEVQEPLPGDVEDRGDDPEGYGTAVSDAETTDPKPVDERIDGTEEGTPDEVARPAVPPSPESSSRPTPAPRPRVTQVPSTVIRRQDSGVSRIGAVAADAQFGRFGEYQARMIEVISVRWNALLDSRAYGESGTFVTIGFTITSSGDITNIETLRTSAQQFGVLLSRSAIEQGQPYGRWSEDMVKTFGNEKEFVVTFYYR